MEITKTTTGFAIKFPFALKDGFRKAFPSAKWNAFTKTWEVGPKSENRLKQWVGEVTEAAANLATLEEKELAETEIDDLRGEIERLQRETASKLKEITALGDIEARLNALREKLKATRERFQAASSSVEAAQKTVAAAEAGVRNTISAVIDLSAVEEARAQMARWHKQVGSTARQKFEEAQAEVCKHQTRLAKAGWGLTGLDFLAGARFNRPDKDHPSLMPKGAMLDLYELSDED